MDMEEIENKYRQYMQLWILYAEISTELKKNSELSKESAEIRAKCMDHTSQTSYTKLMR